MNWNEFFAMNGYGLYVWGSYGMVMLVFIIEIVMVRHRRMLVVRHLRQMHSATSDV
ncbi:MAG: heme exporter protein CcmD [Candidatus Nitrotoga sp.]